MAKKSEKPTETEIKAIKGFDLDWTCRGFQYEIGKTYTHDGPVVRCAAGGFHAIEGHPLEAFGYYPPGTSRYAEVSLGGEIARDDSDSKVAAARITIHAEIQLHDVIQRAVKWVFDHAKPSNRAHANKERQAASATGYQGAASATGTQGAAMSGGYAGRVMGKAGNALFLVERNDSYEIIAVWAGIVGRDGIEPDVFYTLKNGRPVAAQSPVK